MENQKLEEKFGACFLEDGDGGLISDEEEELMPFPRSYNTKYKDWLEEEDLQSNDTKEANHHFKPPLAMMEYFKPVSVAVAGPQEGPQESLDHSKVVLKSEDEEQVLGRMAIQTSTESDFLSSPVSTEETSKSKNVKEISFAPPQNIPKVEDDDEDMEKKIGQTPKTLDLFSKCNLN